jgi:hypothetical protein
MRRIRSLSLSKHVLSLSMGASKTSPKLIMASIRAAAPALRQAQSTIR